MKSNTILEETKDKAINFQLLLVIVFDVKVTLDFDILIKPISTFIKLFLDIVTGSLLE